MLSLHISSFSRIVIFRGFHESMKAFQRFSRWGGGRERVLAVLSCSKTLTRVRRLWDPSADAQTVRFTIKILSREKVLLE
ncbi:hypothetical protein KP509_1Z169400 [Ceratopteris richardii]|nr:hypothetical protein KP509_1Z169400 [Ceratopteris richardii]